MQAKSAITIAGKYVLVRKLATDATTELYLARRTDKGGVSQVVIRRLLAELSSRKDLQDAFREEARISSALSHPNVLRVIEIGGGADPFIAMEFIQGHPLARVAQTQAQKGTGIPPQYGLAVVLDAARGLYYAHEKTDAKGKPMGIVHRFLSPQKIVVGYDGVSRVIDFGVTRPWFRVDGDVAGALERMRYLAPEQVKGQPVGPSSDIFSLGTILYELTTGRPPFDAATPQALSRAIAECNPVPPTSFVPGYPDDMEELVMAALAVSPEKRIQNGGALAAALEVFLVRHDIAATPASVAGYLRGLFGGGAAAPGSAPVGVVPPARRAAPAPEESPFRENEFILNADPTQLDLMELSEITGSALQPLTDPALNVARALPAGLKPAAPSAPGTRAPWDAGAKTRVSASPASAPSSPAATVAAPAPPPAPATPAGPSLEEQQLRERVTALAKEAAVLRQESGPMREELARVKGELAAARAEVERLSARAIDLEGGTTKQGEELAAARAELAKVKADAAAAAAATTAKETALTQKLDAAIAREEEAKKGEAAANDREGKTRRDLEVYKARDGAMRKEMEGLKTREAAAKQELEKLRLKESVLEKHAEEGRKSAESSKREADAAKREIAAARQEAEAAKKASAAKEEAVARQIEAIQKEAAAKRDADVAGIEATTRKAVDEARAAAQKAKTEADEAKATLEISRKDADKSRMEANRLRHELEDAKAEIGVAQQALQAILEENAQKARAEAEAGKKVATASHEAESARKAQEAARAETDAALKAAAAAREEAARAAAEAQSAREEKARAEQAAREAEERRRAVESTDQEQAAARKAEVAAAMQVVRTAMQEADAARAEAEAAKAAAEAAKREADVARADAAAALERAEVARSEAEHARAEAEQTRLAAEKARAEAAAGQEAAEEAAREAEARLREADEKKADASRRISEEREAAKRREAEAKKIEESQIQVLATAMRSVEVAKSEADEAFGVAEAAKQEAEAARKAAEAARAQAESMRREAEAARKEAEKAKQDADAAKREAEDLRRDAEAARREAEAIRAVADVASLSPAPSAPIARAAPAPTAAPAAKPKPPEPRVVVEEPSHPPAPRPEAPVKRPSMPPLPRTNLTAVPGAFVGRSEALRALEPLVTGSVTETTLAGAPGSGRSRLARRFASQHMNELAKAGGVWLVDLSGARDAPDVVSAVAAALGIAPFVGRDAKDAVHDLGAVIAARGKSLFVLVGVDAVASQIGVILDEWRAASKEPRFLLVAEKPLGIAHEKVFDVGPLALPPAGQAVDSEAGRLFVARAREQSRDGTAPPPAANEDVCRIVRLLAGQPLAIELIAARSEDFTIAALYNDLHEQLGGEEIPSEPRTLLPRVLEWSWGRLATWEQDALAQASSFAAEFTVDAADAVIDLAAHADAPTIEEVLRELAAAALLRARAGADPREPEKFEMHPAVRAFAAERLAETDQAKEATLRHAQWVLRAGRALLASLETPASLAAQRRLDLFHRDMEAALARVGRSEPASRATADLSLDLVRCLETVWLRRGLAVHGLECAGAAIERAADADPMLVSEARVARGRLARAANRLGESELALQAARSAAAAKEDRRFEARVLSEIGLTQAARGQGEQARHSLEQALAIAKRSGDPRLEATLLGRLGDVTRSLGKLELARNCHEQAAALAATLGDKRLEADLLEKLAAAQCELGALEDARHNLDRALSFAPALGDRLFEARVFAALGSLALEEGREAEARELYGSALAPLAQLGARRDEAIVRGSLGIVDHLEGKHDDAKARFAASSRLLDELGERALDALFLAHLAALEAARGATENATAVLETARRRLKDAPGASGYLAAADVLSAFLDIARARKSPDPNAGKLHREAAAKKLPAQGAGSAARIAGRLLQHALDGL